MSRAKHLRVDSNLATTSRHRATGTGRGRTLTSGRALGALALFVGLWVGWSAPSASPVSPTAPPPTIDAFASPQNPLGLTTGTRLPPPPSMTARPRRGGR